MKKNQSRDNILKRIFKNIGRLKNKYIYAFLLLFFTGISLLINHYRFIWNSQASQTPQQVTVLYEGYQIGVVSLNLDKDVDMNGRGDVSGAKPLKDMISESLAEGKKWDVVGLQEMKESRPEKPRNEKDFDDFVRIMQELDQGTYTCAKQQEFSNDFFSGICTKYPIIEGSYREKVVWRSSTTDQSRVFLCIQVQSPAGILPICTTHPRAGSNPPAQFKDAENWLFSTVLDSYVPSDIAIENRQTFVNSLRARLIVTGDMNTGVNTIQGRLMTACGGIAPPNTSCDIDQVMYANMTYPEFQHQEPFNRQYLVSEGGYRDTTRAWPTDHGGPSIVSFTTKELTVQIAGEVLATPTSTVISPTAIPTQSISVLNPNVLNGKPVIRMINFNPGSVASPDDPLPKWQGFANYVKSQNVELIFLQEPALREIETIKTVFQSGFPYMTYIKSREGGELNPILSRYPFVAGSQKEWEISPDSNPKRRIVLSVDVQTPYGILRAVNLHTHGDSQCADAFNALEPITNSNSSYFHPGNQHLVIAGDFNIKLRASNPESLLLESVCFKNTDYAQRLADIIRLHYKSQCLDAALCQNIANGPNENIEMVWSLKGNPLEIYKMWDAPTEISNQYNDANRHPVVFAEIGDPSWTLPATPTPIQILPSTTPSVVPAITNTTTPTVNPSTTPIILKDITINLKLKLQGITAQPINTADITGKVTLRSLDGKMKKDMPVTLKSRNNSFYEGAVIFTQVDLAKPYTLAVKPLKHLQVLICNLGDINGKDCSKGIVFQEGDNHVDLTPKYIMAGDLDPQNGIIDSYDISFIRNNLGTHDKNSIAKGDLNFDHVLDTQDYVLAIGSSQQRLDEE